MSSQLDYYTFMGFNPDELRLRYATYADRFKKGSRVLDVGCGRGEFLELLAVRKVDGLGIDADEAMVGEVTKKGLQAVAGEANGVLDTHPHGIDGGFAAAHPQARSPDREQAVHGDAPQSHPAAARQPGTAHQRVGALDEGPLSAGGVLRHGGAVSELPRVSLIILNYNGRAVLDRCLQSAAAR